MAFSLQPAAFQELHPLPLSTNTDYQSIKVGEEDALSMLANTEHPSWRNVLQLAMDSVLYFQPLVPELPDLRTGGYIRDEKWYDFQAMVFLPTQTAKRVSALVARLNFAYTPMATVNTIVSQMPPDIHNSGLKAL